MIIDEVESVMEEIFSKICRLKSEEIWKSFKRILDGAEKIVCLDGFLSDLSISFFVQICRDIKEMILVKSTYIIQRGFFWEVGAPRKLVKAKADGRDTGYSVEGLINLMHKTQNQEKQLELKNMIDSAMEFWFAKCSLLLHGLNAYGPINAVTMYQTFEKNLLLKKFHYSIRLLGFILSETIAQNG